MSRNTAWLYVTISLMAFTEHYKSWTRDIIIIITTIIIMLLTFTHCIYNYIPETNRVHRVHIVLQLFCIYSLC